MAPAREPEQADRRLVLSIATFAVVLISVADAVMPSVSLGLMYIFPILAFAGFVPPYEATLAKNLRDAGAVIIAKTTMTELANWVAGPPTQMPTGYNALAGYSMNPYDPRRDGSQHRNEDLLRHDRRIRYAFRTKRGQRHVLQPDGHPQ